MPKTPDRFREFARMGAALRLGQLLDEMNQIYKAFPALRLQKRGTGRVVSRRADESSTSTGPAPTVRRRKRRKLTTAEKKAISKRMTSYWARRKKTS